MRFVPPVALLGLMIVLGDAGPAHALIPPGYVGTVVHVTFDGSGTYVRDDSGPTYHADANVTWHAEYDVTVPDLARGFGSRFNSVPSEAGTTVSGTGTVIAPAQEVSCIDQPIIVHPPGGGPHETPFMGVWGGPYDYSSLPTIVLYVDAFGGYDYDLCMRGCLGCGPFTPAGGGLSWTFAELIAKFDFDMDEWTNQPPHEKRIPVGITRTASVESETASVDWAGTITLSSKTTTAHAWVTSVEFGGSAGDAFSPVTLVPGTPVVADLALPDAVAAAIVDMNPAAATSVIGQSLRRVTDVVPSAPECPFGADTADWVDCGLEGPPDGTPEKTWPVLFVRGTPLELRSAVFVVKDADFTDAMLVGTATVDGTTLTFTVPGITFNNVGAAPDRIVVGGVTSDAALPDRPGVDRVTITWRFVQAGKPDVSAGSSSHPIYVTFVAPPSNGPQFLPYLTLVDMATLGAAGATNPADAVAGIWEAFQTRRIYRRDLDATTGTVTTSAAEADVLKYYDPWTLEVFLENTYRYPQRCYGTLALLTTKVSRCGEWAEFFQQALALHGLESDLTTPRDVNAAAWKAAVPKGTEYMLVKPWTFQGKRKGSRFPWLTRMRLRATGASYGGAPAYQIVGKVQPYQIRYDQNGKPPAQGDVRLPKGLFNASPDESDHAIVVLGGTLYDPSYGGGPFASLEEWIPASLDGWARADGKTCPLPPDPTVTASGKVGVCRFRARKRD